MFNRGPIFLSKAAYFFYFGAAASLIPFLTLYYEAVGLSGGQIGFVIGIVPLIMLFSAFLWGGIADATQKHRLLLLLSIGGSWLAVLALSRAALLIWLIPIVILYAFFAAPIVPFIDNAVMGLLGERKREYGKLRLWGAAGWGVVATGAGALIEQSGLQWAFYGYLIFIAGLWVVAFRLPIDHAKLSTNYWHGLRGLLANRRWLLFLFIILIQGIGSSITMNFLFLHVEKLGASKTVMGLSLAFATVSEFPFWLASERLLKRWGTQRLLAFSMVALSARAFAYSLMQAPWLILPIGLLHGGTFTVMWTAGVAYAAESAPPGMGATAQGLFSGTAFGLGGALGGFIGGLLYENIGAAPMFGWVGGGLLLGFVMFLLAQKNSARDDAAQVARG